MGGGGLTKALTIGGALLGAYYSGGASLFGTGAATGAAGATAAGATLGSVASGAAIGAAGGMAAGSLLDKPKAPDVSGPSTMTSAMGDVVGTQGGATFNESEQAKQRGAVTKKRLGAKQLQIPLANAAAGGVNTAPSGVNV